MDTLFNKVISKATVVALRHPAVYRAAAGIAARRHAGLPSIEAANAVLKMASPKPVTRVDVEPRHWPAAPVVDVSVVVPCYNVELFVEGCIRSIATQRTTRSFEIVAIDDGSTDKTGAILDSLVDEIDNLNVIHQQNRGLSGARNVGIANVRGGSIVFVDSDDMLKEGALETLANAREATGADFVTASYDDMSENGAIIVPTVGKRNHGAPWGRLYLREVWRNIDFPEGFWFEDTIQAFLIDPMFSETYVDESVYLYRRNNGGITARASNSKKGLDSFWIAEELLLRADAIGVPYDQAMHDRVVRQLGPITWWRCAALSEAEKKALFVLACELYTMHAGGFTCSLPGKWTDVERGLKECNYSLWKTAILGLS